MFGTNKISALTARNEPLTVNSIFATIQGEGPWSGYPAIFLRLAGCNLRCNFCDTEFETHTVMSNFDIVNKIADLHKETFPAAERRVVLTGGEPARQDCTDLLLLLKEKRFHVQMETAGTYYPSSWIASVLTVISPKTKYVHPKFYENLSFADWKYVIKAGEVSEDDGLPTGCTQADPPGSLPIYMMTRLGAPARPPKHAEVWLSPMDEGDEAKNEANRKAVAASCMKFGYRAMLQIHKFLGLD